MREGTEKNNFGENVNHEIWTSGEKVNPNRPAIFPVFVVRQIFNKDQGGLLDLEA